MATVQPPTTLDEWREWEANCAKAYRWSWIPKLPAMEWPEGVTEGAGWFTTAPDHPFKGKTFCLRCLAEAQEFTGCETVPHKSSNYTICFQATRDEATEHPEPDAVTPEPGSETYVRPTHVTDTGTGFYERKA